MPKNKNGLLELYLKWKAENRQRLPPVLDLNEQSVAAADINDDDAGDIEMTEEGGFMMAKV